MEEVFASQRVYGPALHAAGTRDTVHCEFDRPFSWNGVGNVVVTTMMNDADTSAPQSPLFYGYSTPTGVNSTVRSHLVDEPFTPDNAASGSAAVSQYRPTVRFHTAQCAGEAECVPPTLWVRQVEPRAAHLEWIPGHGEAGWDVLYRRQGDAEWTVAAHAIDTNYYCLTPLEAYSPYEAKVVPLCGDSTDYARVTFSTLCAPVDSLPLTEDFEHFVASLYGDAPVEPCWHRNRVYPFPYVRTNYAYSGRQSLLMHTDRSTRRCYIATPEMDMEVDGLQVQFFAYDMGYVSNFPLLIGVMTDPDDYSTFVEVARVTNPVPQQWEMHEVPLDAYRGDGRHIALMMQGGEGELDYGLMYVDDLTIGYIPPCQRPRTVTVDRITRTTAVVQWDGRGVRNYEVEYGPAGFVPGTGSVVATMLDSVTLTGLSHSTRYDVYVRGVCDLEPGQVSNSYSERSLVVTFNTLCGEIESLPYVQDFAHLGVGEGTRPPCWECGGRNGYPYVVEADGGVSQGRMFYMPSSPTRAYAILPAVDTVRFPLSSLQVSVKAHSDAEYSISRSHALVVGVCQTEGDMLSFTPFDTVTLTPEPTVYEVPLAGAAGLGRYVTFVSMPVEGAYSNIVYLDSVVN